MQAPDAPPHVKGALSRGESEEEAAKLPPQYLPTCQSQPYAGI